MNNVKQWTGLSLPVLLHAAQDSNTEGKETRGRQKKKQWMDNVKQWTGLSQSVLLHVAQGITTEGKGTRGRQKKKQWVHG